MKKAMLLLMLAVALWLIPGCGASSVKQPSTQSAQQLVYQQPWESYKKYVTVTHTPSGASGYYTVKGTVYNDGDKPIRFLQVKVIMKSKASGSVLDTTSTYALDSLPLEPGERRSWSASFFNTYTGEAYQYEFDVQVLSFRI